MNIGERRDPMDLLRAANPAPVAAVQAELTLDQHFAALDRAMALGTAGARAPTAGRLRRRLTRSRIFGLSAVASAAAAAAALLLLGGSPVGPREPEFAGAAVKVAEANPRLLITAPGWRVSRADEFQVDSGEVEFTDGTHTLQINWSPAKFYGVYYRDRAEVDPSPRYFDLLGERTRTVAYSDHDFATMLRPQGPVFLEIRSGIHGGGMSFDDYRALIESLKPVDVNAWLSAMPPTVVQPTDRGAVVNRMLADVPLPPGFDGAPLRTEDGVLDRYQLAARAMNAVTCGWVGEWIAATRADDGARAEAAVDALNVASKATVLNGMTREGAYPRVFTGFVRQFARGQLPGHAARPLADNIPELQAWVRMGFGCE